MKWRTDKIGDLRVRRRFALLPHECSDGTTRWLEWVTVVSRYGPDPPFGCRWNTIAVHAGRLTVDESRRIEATRIKERRDLIDRTIAILWGKGGE